VNGRINKKAAAILCLPVALYNLSVVMLENQNAKGDGVLKKRDRIGEDLHGQG
jgi:hypothetical protein